MLELPIIFLLSILTLESLLLRVTYSQNFCHHQYVDHSRIEISRPDFSLHSLTHRNLLSDLPGLSVWIPLILQAQENHTHNFLVHSPSKKPLFCVFCFLVNSVSSAWTRNLGAVLTNPAPSTLTSLHPHVSYSFLPLLPSDCFSNHQLFSISIAAPLNEITVISTWIHSVAS